MLGKMPVKAEPNGISTDGTYVYVAVQGTHDNPGNTIVRMLIKTALASG